MGLGYPNFLLGKKKKSDALGRARSLGILNTRLAELLKVGAGQEDNLGNLFAMESLKIKVPLTVVCLGEIPSP